MDVVVATGRGLGDRVVRGTICLVDSRGDLTKIEEGDIVVLWRADVETVLWIDRLRGIIARTGSIVSHLALVAAEFGIPYLVLGNEMQPMRQGETVELDPLRGLVTRVSA